MLKEEKSYTSIPVWALVACYKVNPAGNRTFETQSSNLQPSQDVKSGISII